jgi:hypothetical protein
MVIKYLNSKQTLETNSLSVIKQVLRLNREKFKTITFRNIGGGITVQNKVTGRNLLVLKGA